MDQEISLREIIEIIFKGKWIIIVVTVAAMIIAGIVSIFVISPTYEANSIVRVGAPTQENVKPLDINTFIESVKSDTAINRIIEKLELDPSVHTISSIRNQIQVEALKDVNIMKIKVKGNDALLITNMANMLAYELGYRIEITNRSQSIVEDQRKLKDITDEINSSKGQLEEAKKQLKSIPEKQTTRQTIGDNPLLTSVAQESSKKSTSDLLDIEMQSETVNPAYTTVQTQIATISINLTKLTTDESNLKARINESSERIKILETQMEKEKLSVKKSDRLLDGAQAIFVSPAFQPNNPIGPNKVLNVAIAAIVGLMFSTLFIFLRNYLRNSSDSK